MPTTKPTPAERERRTFKTFFFRGLGVLLPSVLTLWILWAAFQFVQRNVAEPLNAGVRHAVTFVVPRVVPKEYLPPWFEVRDEQVAQMQAERRRQGQFDLSDQALRAEVRASNFREYWEKRWYLRLIGLVIAVGLFYAAGVALGGFLGRSIYERIERWATRVPVFKQVYPSVKQVVDFVFGDKKQLAFSRVVLVQYPRHGVWSLGLVTGPAMPTVERAAGAECLTVFVPSSPTPFTGYAVTVPKADVLDLPITIDEALKFVVSGGVLAPGVHPLASALPPGAGSAREPVGA